MKIQNYLNKKAGIPSLTTTVISLAVFITAILLCVNIYSSTMTNNGGTIDTSYLQSYNQITSYKSNLNNLGSNYSKTTVLSLLTGIPSVIAGSTNIAFTIGLGAIRTMSILPDIINGMFGAIESTLHIPSELSWLILFVVTIYVASVLIQAWRGTLKEV